MRTFGLTLVVLAAASGALAAFRTEMPFRIPLTSYDAGYWALVLIIAAVLALLAGNERRA